MARGKDRDDDGPSKNQLRGLSYNHNLPSFLRNAQTALSGGSGQRQTDGRPPIPTRPGGTDDDDDNKLDERDLGDEAPLVVVLNESKDLTAEEAAQAQQDAPPVFENGSAPTAKRGATLRFSSNDKASNKRKIVGRSYEDDEDEETTGAGESESFSDLVKRAKVDPSSATTAKELPTSSVSKPVKKDKPEEEKKEKKQLTKEEKAALKAKRKSAKKLLSFED
ncbi:hypothetical protein P389DRAFT_63875 [Cystobasidium minutum MCA 4210]|uniref:uncharacterized protein n=1 Tax=Cystobasidium minutum MCA 4210 TaxID=1397322 RepID=UPI0034CF33F5|eukprot:jgi/Rhomi1/63875/CE63874_2050